MDAAAITNYWSFYAVKTPKLKNGMEAIFQHPSLTSAGRMFPAAVFFKEHTP